VPNSYNPRSVIRHIPNALLKRFFKQFPEFSNFDWEELRETQDEPVFDTLQTLAEPERNRIDMVFRKVHSLADSLGTTVLIEAARDSNRKIAAEIGAMQNAYERALWCHLEHPAIFEDARTLAHIDGLARNSWEKRKGLPKQAIKVTEGVRERLGKGISGFYEAEEGRGQLCIVEHRRREGDLDWFFAYPSDYPDEREGYRDDGKFIRESWRPAFEVVFVYDHSAGALELFAKGGKNRRAMMSSIFAKCILGVDDESEPWQADTFDLEVFKNPDIKFPTKAADKITLVRVTALRLQIHRTPGGRLTFQVNPRRKDVTVYDFVAVALNERRARFADCTVHGVTMQAIFQKPNGKDRRFSFNLSEGSKCDLGDSPEELLLRRYLKVWKSKAA